MVAIDFRWLFVVLVVALSAAAAGFFFGLWIGS